MLRRGKKATKWDRVRAELKKEFEAKGIVTCEICGRSDYLSFAHRLKRRFITDEEELRQVALLCEKHHANLEYGGHDRMYAEITKIIARRGAC